MRSEFDIPITSFISKFLFTWEWTITAIPICNTGSEYTANTLTRTTEQHLYVILEEPQAPMSLPWAGVLEYACEWAEGESYIEDATTKITEHLNVCGLNYNIAPQYTGSETQFFNIIDFLLDLEDPQSKMVNCLDMARAVVTFSNGIGANLIVAKYVHNIQNRNVFPVNHIDPIGVPINGNTAPASTNNPFAPNGEDTIANDCRMGGFSYHSFAMTQESILSNSKIWDATLQYDIDNDRDNVGHDGQPGVLDCENTTSCGGTLTGEIWEIPCNVPYNSYLNKLVDDWIKCGTNCEICCSEPNDPCGVINYPYQDGFILETPY